MEAIFEKSRNCSFIVKSVEIKNPTAKKRKLMILYEKDTKGKVTASASIENIANKNSNTSNLKNIDSRYSKI